MFSNIIFWQCEWSNFVENICLLLHFCSFWYFSIIMIIAICIFKIINILFNACSCQNPIFFFFLFYFFIINRSFFLRLQFIIRKKILILYVFIFHYRTCLKFFICPISLALFFNQTFHYIICLSFLCTCSVAFIFKYLNIFIFRI